MLREMIRGIKIRFGHRCLFFIIGFGVLIAFADRSQICHADVIHVPGDYPTIQAGIDAAVNGDVVEIADGTYVGVGNTNLDFLGKAITVRSASGDPELCVIDCEYSSRGFYFQNGEGVDSVVEGLTITKGDIMNEGGGGVLCVGSSPSLINCRITGSQGYPTGGGVFCSRSSPIFIHCVISGNFAWDNGGGVSCRNESNPSFIGCIFARNSAWEGNGGGVYCDHSDIILTNCILWSNDPREIALFLSDSQVTYSNIEGGWDGEGNIESDPLFIDLNDYNYRLSAGSPCIDAGNNEAVPDGIVTDLDGNPRFVEDPLTPDTGNGTPPIVDIGCYEYRSEEMNAILTISPDPLIAGRIGVFSVIDAYANTDTYLAYSLRGVGSTYIPYLDITLDINQPIQACDAIETYINGKAQWYLSIPTSAAGVDVWFQACQYDLATNVVETRVE